jgi:demethylmenaquinone methyltransferase/2-methoxy-6-polyprenyl-1,4-benzoquinol methylase
LAIPEGASYVQKLFARIAHRYDLMNFLMTFGQDQRWRREVIHRANLPSEGRLLDLGAGTGNLALESLRQSPHCHPVAADFTIEMIRVAQDRGEDHRPYWCNADALRLPFPENSFDAVVSGFLLRNVIDLPKTLREQYRTLKPKGRMVALDTTKPTNNPLSPLIHGYFQTVIPMLGHVVAGDKEAYMYLQESTANFLEGEQLAARMLEAGFRNVRFRRLMFNSVAIHWGEK